jgi:hypothetical protein
MSSGIHGGGDSTSTGLAGVSHPVESASSALSTGRDKSKYMKKVHVNFCMFQAPKQIETNMYSTNTIYTHKGSLNIKILH